MRKILLVLIMALAMLCFTSCGGSDETAQTDGRPEAPKIVVTIFPEYDWVMNILGDNPAGAEVTMLLDSGVDLHSFQPKTEDMLKVSESDVFIYVGGSSDAWVEDAIKNATNPNQVVINLMEVIGDEAKEEEVVEGMQAEGEEAEEAEGSEPELDEHVWLSLQNAKLLCSAIEEGLAKVDPANAEIYEANLGAYLGRIDALDAQYSEVTSKAKVKTLLFGDRFPFRYLTDEYGLEYYAAFVGCSAETEASFETVKFLAEKLDELDLPCVMTIDGSDQKLAETIVQSTKGKDQKILTMNSMQAVTAEDVEKGASYIGIMEENLESIRQALQ